MRSTKTMSATRLAVYARLEEIHELFEQPAFADFEVKIPLMREAQELLLMLKRIP